jgi:Holliday junction resolvase
MSRAPKYAKTVDANQQEIVDALRQIGCEVVVIGTPVDILCGFRKRNFLIEVKRDRKSVV